MRETGERDRQVCLLPVCEVVVCPPVSQRVDGVASDSGSFAADGFTTTPRVHLGSTHPIKELQTQPAKYTENKLKKNI